MQACERDRCDVVARRAKWLRNQSRWDADRLVFPDETGVNRAMTPRFAWSPRGERDVSKAPHDPGVNISIVGATGRRGLLAADWKVGGFNGGDFEAFVRELLLPKLKRGDTVVMDNASIHKRPIIKKLLAMRGVRLRYLPPYSPELNPIENEWSKIKGVVNRLEPRTVDGAIDAVAKGFAAVTRSDRDGWLRNAGYRVS